MARVLVDIDEGLKRELKVKLLRDGVTLKDWLTRSALDYLRTGRAPSTHVSVPTVPVRREIPEGLHPQAGAGRVEPKPEAPPPAPARVPVVRAHEDDYLD